MIVEVVSIRDRLNGFGPLMLENNVESAKRNFADAIEESKVYGKHIEDFSLYRLCSFDTDHGITVDLVPDSPELICTAFDLTGGKL